MEARDLYQRVESLGCKVHCIQDDGASQSTFEIRDSQNSTCVSVSSPGADWAERLSGCEDAAEIAFDNWVKGKLP